MRHVCFAVLLLLAGSLLNACGKDQSATPQANATAPAAKRQLLIGFLGKSQANDVFRVAEAGAKAAVVSLQKKYNISISLELRTPSEEDATKQAEAIEALTRMGADGIAVSASEGNTLRPAVDKAVEKGVVVITFDSDVPNSKRLAYYGCDDVACGARLLDYLAQSMHQKGTVAILAGNQSAPNLQLRVKGVENELQKYPDMQLLQPNGVFYHQETPEKAAEAVADAMNANPGIQGWAMVGGWPLFTTDALRWDPGTVKVCSWDALPAELTYLRDGHVDVLLAQDCYGWGYKTVTAIVEKIIDHKDPDPKSFFDPLTPVTKENVDAWAQNWKVWLPS